MEQGSAIIPGVSTRAAKYPTVDTENCISALTVADITDNMDLTFKGPIVNPNGNFVWGLGIQKSNIFSWVRPIDPSIHYPKRGGYVPAPGQADSSWGMLVGRNFTEDANGGRFKDVDVRCDYRTEHHSMPMSKAIPAIFYTIKVIFLYRLAKLGIKYSFFKNF